uniref:Two component response regulator protein n=2 Tax=root TaxID=1 RepID=M1L796_9BACT|nr:two component response regulator protein [uncultured prokaryote]AGF34096.1 two component response regulator protein [uncultured bacterium DX-1A-14]
MQIGVEASRAVENKRVFVIESDEVSAVALQFMLADECETHVLPDSATALAKGREWPPNLILLGAGIIAAEGARIVAQLKAQWSGLKILVVADSVDDPAVKAAKTEGADSVLLRPLTLEAVRRKVDTQLGRRAALDIPVVLT